MINYIREEETVTKQYTDSVSCDVCGHVYSYSGNEEFEAQEFFHIGQCGGYGSVFGDGMQISMDICQHCMKKIIERFGINVRYEDVDSLF